MNRTKNRKPAARTVSPYLVATLVWWAIVTVTTLLGGSTPIANLVALELVSEEED